MLTGAIVLVLYAVVQFTFLQGPYPFDSAKYFRTAVDFPTVPPDIWTLRIGLVLPVTAAVRLFGPSEAALYTVPILVGLLLAAAVYGTMLLLFRDRLLAALAALVTVLNTNYLLKSSSIFADTSGTASFAAGFFCLVATARADEQRRRWAPTVFAVFSGVLFGWTYLIREFSLVLVPAVVAGLVLLRYPLRRAAILLGAALVTVGIELLYGLLRYQDPLIHARILRAERYRPPRTSEAALEHIRGQLDSFLDTIIVFPRLLLAWQTGWTLLLLIVLLFAGLALRFRDRRLWLLAVWCFSFWITMAVLGLGTLPSGRWIVNITIIRYWYPIFPPLVMGAFAAVALLVPGRLRILGRVSAVHAVAGALAALVLVPGFVEFRQCESKEVWVNDDAERWHDLRSWLGTPEADRYDVIWTDVNTARLLPAFTSSRFGHPLWEGAVNTLPRERGRLVPPPGRPRSLLLVHRGQSREITRLDEVRRDWSPVFVSDDEGMVLLAHASSPTRRVPPPEKPLWSPLFQNAAVPGECGRPWVRTPPSAQMNGVAGPWTMTWADRLVTSP